jgi:hypothetical protein
MAAAAPACVPNAPVPCRLAQRTFGCPLCSTKTPMRSATSAARPFSCTISVFTSSHGAWSKATVCERERERERARERRYLVQFIHRGTYRAEFLRGHAADLKDGVQELAVVELDEEGPDGERGEDLRGDRDDFGVGDHGRVATGHVEIALVEFAVPPAVQLRLVPPVDLEATGGNEAINTNRARGWAGSW